VLGGVGIGAAYVCPIATCVKWFPDKKGLITGLAVAGFGAGALFFAPLAKGLISGVEYELLGLRLFSLPELEVFDTFLVLGIVFLVTVVAGAQLLRDPPDGYVVRGYAPPESTPGSTRSEHFTPAEMLRTPTFWLLWLTYFAGCTAGLQVIMKASPIWQSFSFSVATPPIAEAEFHRVTSAGATAVSVLAIFNSLGRIFWGKVSDAIGRKPALLAMFVVCGPAMLALDGLRSFPQYLAGISVVGLCFGGFLALYPAVTADFYGTKHLGANYGWLFTAYGAGGLFGPFLAAWLMKVEAKLPYRVMEPGGRLVERQFAVGNYRQAFLVAGMACLGAATVCLLLRAPRSAKVEAQDANESSVA
jgi:MFS transporter, OFA family, oxalate/formate antiporter